jgi:hypothetical protein
MTYNESFGFNIYADYENPEISHLYLWNSYFADNKCEAVKIVNDCMNEKSFVDSDFNVSMNHYLNNDQDEWYVYIGLNKTGTVDELYNFLNGRYDLDACENSPKSLEA